MEMKSMAYEWHINLSVIILALAIILFYSLVSGFKRNRNIWYFLVSMILLFLTECAPLHYLASIGDFSAHMVSHVVLLLLCGPLLVISIPSKPVSGALKPLVLLSAFFGRRVWAGWIIGVGIMWLWHMPSVFNSVAGKYMLLHNGSILLAGMAFSWPLFGPVKSDRVHPVYGIVYLFTACISCSLLGLLITFAPLNTYGNYSQPDQQSAGLIMWVPCCFVYLSGCIYLLIRWFNERTTEVYDGITN